MNNLSSNRFKTDLPAPSGTERHRRRKISPVLLLFILLTFCFPFVVSAQPDDLSAMPKDAEPPPLKIISKEERDQLNKETKVKDRIKLSLELMDLRLQKAEQFNNQNDYKDMFKELGRFHALVDNALAYLNRKDTGREGFLNNFKRFEIGLREFLPRLELIRRVLPLNFEYYVRNLIINVREARRKAVDPFFDDSVVPDNNAKGS